MKWGLFIFVLRTCDIFKKTRSRRFQQYVDTSATSAISGIVKEAAFPLFSSTCWFSGGEKHRRFINQSLQFLDFPTQDCSLRFLVKTADFIIYRLDCLLRLFNRFVFLPKNWKVLINRVVDNFGAAECEGRFRRFAELLSGGIRYPLTGVGESSSGSLFLLLSCGGILFPLIGGGSSSLVEGIKCLICEEKRRGFGRKGGGGVLVYYQTNHSTTNNPTKTKPNDNKLHQ